MATLDWIGGGNNKASNPNDWSPTAAPQPGDTLTVSSSEGPHLFTMNVSCDDLAGNLVAISNSTFTANLAHHAVMAAHQLISSAATFNLSENSSLNLSLTSGFHVGLNSATINISGHGNLVLNDTDSQVTVNLLHGARWAGTLTMGQFFGVTYGKVTVNGTAQSKFNNNGRSSIVNTEEAIINTDVIGHGSFEVANHGSAGRPGQPSIAKLEFSASVGSHQSIADLGLVVIDKPQHFLAQITL